MEQLNETNYDEIRVLDFPENIRRRWSIYLDSPSMMLREAIDNATDEFLSYPDPSNNLIYINNKDYGGFNVVADRGRGIPIFLSKDRPGQCQALVAVSTMHAGSKFGLSQNTQNSITTGLNGVGISSSCALSERFIVMSKITQENYDKSIPCVKTFYESLGPRSKKESFYYAYFECGYLKAEGAAKRKDLEKMLGLPKELPEGMSTIILFQVDSTIFANPKTEIPVENLETFLFIQEKFYKRKSSIQIVANDQIITSSGFQTYKFEILKTITPQDTSKNGYLGIYVTFECDPSLSPKHSDGSVNGLICPQGVHITAIEKSFEESLRAEYKINHRYVYQGLKLRVILLAEELIYDSQNKSRLKSIPGVKQSDFSEITKEFQKIFRKNDDYWRPHVDKLNALAESYRSIGAVEKAQKMIDASKGNSGFRMKGQNYVEGFSDATSQNRWDCELFLCFTGETEMLTCNNERISMVDLVKRIEEGEEIYTFSCEPSGKIVPSKVLAAREIQKVNQVCKITLDNGESFRCTPDHKLMMRDGTYKEAKDLVPGDSMMPCYTAILKPDENTERRYVMDMSGQRIGRHGSDNFSKSNLGRLVPVFHIMSEHPDTIIDSSVNEPEVQIHRHHIDENKFNDSPRNLMICSRQKHFGFHASNNSIILHEMAHKDPVLYNKIYVDNKRTESFKINASIGHKKVYEGESGELLRKIVSEKSKEEWSNEKLRKWRSFETKKYAEENPDWAKKNIEKKTKTLYERTVALVLDRLKKSKKDLTSSNYNLEVLKLRCELDGKFKGKYYFGDYDFISETYPDLIKEISKTNNDSFSYVLSYEILDRLKSKSLPVTQRNYDEELRDWGYPVKNSKLVTILKGQCFGYRSSRDRNKELFEIYEAILNNNHKIVSVEFLEVENESVYCLEVDSKEHNFPLACGIFAKNCEGLSASAGLKSGRKSTLYHAILPLRGKILSVKDSTVDEALANKEIFTMLSTIGLGIDINFVGADKTTPEETYAEIQKHARYGKIIIATD